MRNLFSVILPIYNLESHLKEAIDSVIGQSFGFQSYVRLVLVDSASEDGNSEICRAYQSQFPKNILYLRLPEKSWPSGAKTLGFLTLPESISTSWGRTANGSQTPFSM